MSRCTRPCVQGRRKKKVWELGQRFKGYLEKQYGDSRYAVIPNMPKSSVIVGHEI